MSKNELVAKIEALNEWEAIMEEAKVEAEAIRDSIKAEMMERDTEELVAGKYIVRCTFKAHHHHPVHAPRLRPLLPTGRYLGFQAGRHP